MTTDKDTQKINRAIDKWFSEHAQAINIFTAEELKEHDKTVADHARKEAAERVRKVMNVSEGGSDTIDKICAAILGDSAAVSTDYDKLAIAVKALEKIRDVDIQHNKIARDALKEIHG